MNFKRINNITGWIIGIFACIVYIMTSEAGGSLWDCGEFVSSCFKVQIPHPPGAPLFILLGRFFIILFGGDGMHAAKGVNVMSAVASGLSILFLFWSITHFARRIVQGKDSIDHLTSGQIWAIMGAGVIGALAYAFSDSFWYSAVEGEVYASSALCTAVAFWSILKWEHVADEPGADRWIVFISFLMGLSIGIHLLNLLTIPALVMVYYFRRKDQLDYALIRKYFVRGILIAGCLAFIGGFIMANKDVTDNVPMDSTYPGLMLIGTLICIGILYLIERVHKNDKAKKINYGGAYIFFVLSVVILGAVQIGVIQETVKIAGAMDVTFVNKLGLPFFSGFTTFFILLGVAIWYCLRLAKRKGLPNLRLAMWCLTFMLIGYSSYLTTMIRSNADPSIDMFKVDNPLSLAGYLGRDQYGDFPILYGQKFTARPVDIKYDDMKYQKGVDDNGKDAYIPIGKAFHYIYMPEDKMVFPRVWNGSMDRGQADYYAQFLGIGKNQQTGAYEDGRPTFGDNLEFYMGYQNYYMFIRYFLWNYSGKQDDIQGRYIGNVRDGNWITGINVIDSFLYGDQSVLPDSLKYNKAHNTMFALPLILGLIGLYGHFKRKGSDTLVVFLLFFMTGFAIIIYLNQAGNEPRERDYAFAGATYAFAIWIGLGMLQLYNWLTSKKIVGKVALATSFLICFFAVPVLMAQQEWDDHDRSKKELARDLAKDYLESCAPNAILFTFGDNDTYPLWYAQEVEGIRPDIRVINTSLLGIDWYINELRHKVNSSDAIDVIFSKSQIQGQKRDVVFYRPKDGIPQNQYYDLYDMMKNYVGSDDPGKMEQSQGGDMINTYPVRNVSVPVDLNVVRQNGTVNADDSVVNAMNFQIAKSSLYKNDWAILNIIAANKWKRPIYFTSPYDELGFAQYLRRDGLTYRLVPVLNRDVQTETVNTAWMYDKAMNKFAFGSADIPGVYFDEENRRHLNTIRQAYATLGMDLAAKGKKEEARNVLGKADKMMLQENFPYGMVSIGNQHNRLSMLFLQAALMADDKTLADKVYNSIKKDLQQQVRYYNALTGQNAANMENDKQISMQMLAFMDNMVKQFSEPKNPALEHGQVIRNDSAKAK